MNIVERKQLEKEEAANKRRKQILAAGIKLFSEKSPGEVTMISIGKECALSPGTIYLYYKSKEDLLFHIMTEQLTTVLEQTTAFEEDTGMQALEKFIGMMKADYAENLVMKNLLANFDLYYEEEYPDYPIVKVFEKKAQEINNYFETLIQQGIDDNSIRPEVNPRLYGCLIGNLGAIFGSRTALRRKILTRNQKIDPYEEYCLVLDLVLNSLKNNL